MKLLPIELGKSSFILSHQIFLVTSAEFIVRPDVHNCELQIPEATDKYSSEFCEASRKKPRVPRTQLSTILRTDCSNFKAFYYSFLFFMDWKILITT